ncbi:BUD32 family EKC/KEOPS complex subunit [Gimesia algae]|uniref:3-deoxy-D-manno-octulosonic-acid kinase n=1 Tax=Gimesia algae TaxID=2527971 RepID=A0A517VDT4_9PLAN|nr:lipopolysaccharide kinase InaA family protein [Gimesia algae]QDT91165.1 3-deoxy-D-manno-octulosonic-acid kinase [Gimesia algae]
MKLSDSHPQSSPCFQLFDQSTPYTTIRCLKEEDLRSVWLLEIPGRGLTTLKRWPVSWQLRWKSFFKQSQPDRQLTGAWKLLKAGVNTPQPATPVYRAGSFYQLEMPYIEGSTAHDLLKSDLPGSHDLLYELARELGKIVRRLAQAGLRHRDLKLENVVVKQTDQNAAALSLWLIDPVGIRSSYSVSNALVCMLDRLAIQPLNEERAVPLSLQIICIRSALGRLSGKERRHFFQLLRKSLIASRSQSQSD